MSGVGEENEGRVRQDETALGNARIARTGRFELAMRTPFWSPHARGVRGSDSGAVCVNVTPTPILHQTGQVSP